MTKVKYALAFAAGLFACALARAEPAFDAFLQSTWPDAQSLGVSRATFDAAHPRARARSIAARSRHSRPAGEAAAQPQQPEFVQTPAQYLREPTFDAARRAGQKTRRAIPRHAGAHREDVRRARQCRAGDLGARDRLRRRAPAARRHAACWRRKAFVGKRKDFFRNEFLHALKMLQDGVPRADLRSSWGGAMGLTQFLPSEYYKYAVDFDGDGHADIWHSVPDALASAAKQLTGQRLAGRRALGDRGARAGKRRLHHRGAEPHACRSANGSSAAMCRPTAAS